MDHPATGYSAHHPTLAPWRQSCAVLAILWCTPFAAGAQDDYDAGSTQWNGLSEFVALLDAEGIEVTQQDRIDLGAVVPGDAMVVLYPTEPPPAASLAQFMREGGRLALADDHGQAEELLRIYRFNRRPADAPDAPHLRGNVELPVAHASTEHYLSEGVPFLVANHAATVGHGELAPIFAFDDSGRGLVTAGAVGDGRFVAIGDPSLFINNMLEFRGNRRFAENLAHYLTDEGSGRLWLVTPNTVLAGRYGELGADRPFHDLRRWLEHLAGADTPPMALTVATVTLVAILLVAAAGSLPRRSPYDGSTMFARPPSSGGFVGRVGFFGRRGVNLLPAILMYKFELESELIWRLNLSGSPLLRDVLTALRARGAEEDDVMTMRRLLIDLDDLRQREDLPPAPPNVTRKRFQAMVADGERVLAGLAATRPDGLRRDTA